MAIVERYTEELVRGYVSAGFWTPEYAVDFWRRNAHQRGERESLCAPDGRYTWSQAVKAIDRIASGLVADGWQRDDVLVLQAQNSAELLLLRLACEAAGVVAALLPLTFSRAEIDEIVRQLVPRGVALPAGERGAELLGLYGDLEFHYTLGGPPHPGTRRASDCEPTYEPVLRGFNPYEYGAIITTSGTTGAPRCVEHAACARLAAGRQYIERLRLTENDVICGFTSIFAGNCDLLLYHAAPQAGAKAVLIDAFEPEAACALLERERATGAIFVPTLLHRLLSSPVLGRFDLSSLRFVTCFGAMLAPEIAELAETRLGVRVIQGYGAAEYGALASTAYDDPPHVRLRGVGKPLPGTEIEIRDKDGQPLPPGSIGRIYARGPHCVGGFVGDREATGASWSSGFLPMGDLGRLDESGFLWLEGRAKDLIIRGGQNIAPLELENVLLRHPAVKEVAAVGMRDTEMGERVCIFVVAADGVKPTLETLREFMLDHGLAKFKLPERMELLSDLPMNPAGNKVNKRALQALLATGSEPATPVTTRGGAR